VPRRIKTRISGLNGELLALTTHLHKHGASYMTANQVPPEIRLFGLQQRPKSRIYWFELRAGDQNCLLRVKIPLHPDGPGTSRVGSNLHTRPRRFPIADLERKFELEYAALKAIHNYFQELGDPRFGSVRVLDFLPDIRANVMEEIKEPSLKQLFAGQTRLQVFWPKAKFDTAFNNAGAWLRAYHALVKPAVTRHFRRSEFIETISSLTHYLGMKLSAEPFFSNVASRAARASLKELPEILPVGLCHGDYAMRNILVGPAGRVTVLDTLARWRTAVFDDIGYFLTNLKMTWPQVITQGMVYKSDLISRYEHQFLKGYFEGEPIPIPAVRLYEVQSLLDKWSANVARRKRLRKHTRINHMHQRLEDRYFKKTLNSLLHWIH